MGILKACIKKTIGNMMSPYHEVYTYATIEQDRGTNVTFFLSFEIILVKKSSSRVGMHVVTMFLQFSSIGFLSVMKCVRKRCAHNCTLDKIVASFIQKFLQQGLYVLDCLTQKSRDQSFPLRYKSLIPKNFSSSGHRFWRGLNLKLALSYKL